MRRWYRVGAFVTTGPRLPNGVLVHSTVPNCVRELFLFNNLRQEWFALVMLDEQLKGESPPRDAGSSLVSHTSDSCYY